MPDREKVIKRLEKCKRHECDNCTEIGASQAPWDCPAFDDFVDNALSLLKEHDAIESIDFGNRTDIMANLEGLTWNDWRMYHSDTEVQNIAQSVFDLLIDTPEIVRCKDCKYCVEEPNGELFCDILAVEYEPFGSKKVTEDWFCADGVRKCLN